MMLTKPLSASLFAALLVTVIASARTRDAVGNGPDPDAGRQGRDRDKSGTTGGSPEDA